MVARSEALRDRLAGEASSPVAIVIPAYNATRFLPATVQSVRAQSHGEWSLTIVDNASTDGTYALSQELAEGDPRIGVIRLDENAGPSGARNAGAGAALKADTEAALFLDSDDLLEPDAIEHLLGVLRDHPDAPAAYGTARFIDVDGRAMNEAILEKNTRTRPIFNGRSIGSDNASSRTAVDSFYFWACIATPGMILIRHSALQSVGLFDTATRPAEDWDMSIRLARLAPLAFTDKVVLGYRQHESQMSHDWRSTRKARSLVLAKAERTAATEAERRLIRQAYRLANRQQVHNKLALAFEAARRWEFRRAKQETLRAAAAATLLSRRGP